MIDQQRLIREAADLGVTLGENAARQLDVYCAELAETNRTLNLTAIVEPRDVEIKHLLDSLAVLSCGRLSGRVADIGTGAGFPGVVLKAACPALDVTLIDATGKKLAFCERASALAGVRVEVVHGRAEELARGALRESFDGATARAVASLPALLEYCLPLVRRGGCFIALKGPEADEEVAASKKALALLGGRVADIRRFALPDGAKRALVIVEKISQTPTKYPRSGKNISKTPL
ncbi:MAG: 16S rRNA (guanine(527)-N(7))-methyltransferase RsmG [Oscillospiraceae bacterium]|nr:16S rRNA (guanine(527)-N(7))-methyltransferase RsmG [Oscillospiraceae bacterium]